MSVNASAHKVKVLIGSDSQDWSKQFFSLQVGWNERDRDGLFQVTGTLTLACNQFAPESMNPRRNRVRWERGALIKVQVTDSDGSYVMLPCGWLYILKTPLPPTIAEPYIKIEVGCWLKLKDYSLPNLIVAKGRTSPVSRTAAIANCLERAASAYAYDSLKPPPDPQPSPPAWIGTGGDYSLRFNLSKVEGSFIQLAGQIAFGGLQNLYQDNQGQINSISSALTPGTPMLTIKIGAPSGEELGYTPTEGSETPVQKLRYVGNRLLPKLNDDYSLSVSEDYGPASIVDPAGGNKPIVIRRITVEQLLGDGTRTKNTKVEAPLHLVSSVAFPKNATLGLDSYTQEVETFEQAADGKLLYSELIEQRLYPAAMPDVFKRQSSSTQAANKNTTIFSKVAKTDYTYKKSVVESQVAVTREPVGAIVTNEASIADPAALIPSQYDSIAYSQPRSKREWQRQTVSNQPLVRIRPDIKVSSTNPSDRVAQKRALTTKTNLIEISNAGQTNPPACERKPQKYSDEEKFIEGYAAFNSYSNEPDDRLRTLELATGAVSSAQLAELAQIEGAILWGRNLGQIIQVPLRDEILNNPVPLQQWLCTEPDGTQVLYQVNGLQFTLLKDRAIVGAHGIWIGTVGAETPYSPSVVDPVYAGLEVSEGELVIPQPAQITRSLVGGLVLGGSLKLLPYPMLQTAAMLGGLVMGGRLSPSVSAAFRGGLVLGGRLTGSPVLDFRGGLVLGGAIAEGGIAKSFYGGLKVGGAIAVSVVSAPFRGGLVMGGALTGTLDAYESETDVLLARFEGTYDTARQDAINALIKGLKDDDLWATLDLLHLYAAATANDAVLNWKGTSFTASLVSSPTFTVDRGVTTDGSSSYINVGYNPAIAGGNYTQNSATMGLYSRTTANDPAGNVDMGAFDGSRICDLSVNSTNLTTGRLNSGTGAEYRASSPGGAGAFSVTRTGSATLAVYRNGTVLTRTDANDHTSSGLVNATLFLGGRNISGLNAPSTRQYAAAWLASGWTATQNSNFYARLQTYLLAIGANI